MLYQAETPIPPLLTLPGRSTRTHELCQIGTRGKESRFVCQFGLFDGHVFEFAGFENLAAFQAFNEFGVFFASHDLHTRVLAFWHVTSLLGDWGLRDWIHKSGLFPGPSGPGMNFAGICAVL
jgi:hypothetical protein